MIFKIQSALLTLLLFFMLFTTAALIPSPAAADPRITGLPELTHEELEWQNKHHNRVKKVKLNSLGLKRINENRIARGHKALTGAEVEVAPAGSDIEAAPGAIADPGDQGIPTADMPAMVDNSQLKFFPPIRSQGSLPTCGSFSGTYYAMTYMWALANDLDAKSGGDDFRLSPKWNNNMVNGGENVGSWYYWSYDIGMRHGTATWAEFPYDSDYREWCLVPSTWQDAIYRRFDTYGYVANTDTDAGIAQVKQMLLNGYVLNFPTYIYSWQWTTIKNDPATIEDDALVGKSIAYWVNGTSGYHAMTVVGYDDTIWTDINGNGLVDNGEKGAFRIANSWGTGWKEGGFCWMAYDALKGTSAVSGAPSSGRIDGWSPARAHWVTARAHYTPQVLAEFTIEHAKRNQLRVTLGLSDTNRDAPTSTWFPQMIALDGGPYAFDGTTTPISGTFVFDFTDLALSATGGRWHLGLYDAVSGDPVELFTYTLIDVAADELRIDSPDMPQTSDAGQFYTAIDYDNGTGNLPPRADVATQPTRGVVPLTVHFDAGGSVDADGTIVAYQWTFGDGANGSGVTVDHTYTSAGDFVATCTVIDDKSATDSATVTINVDAAATLTAPGSLNATVSGSTVTLNWVDTGNTEDGFHIERAMKVRGKYAFTRIATVGAGVTGYRDTVTAAGTYKYRVQAFSQALGLSAYSNEAIVTISTVAEPAPEPTPDPIGDSFPAPSSLIVIKNDTSAHLSWNDNTIDESGFTIERGVKIASQLVWETIGMVDANGTSFRDDCGAGTFYYRVQAFKTTTDPETVSAYSNVATLRIK